MTNAPETAALGPIEQRTPLLTVGVVVWMASEVMFFSALFATYFTLRAADHPWPPRGVELDTLVAGLFTLVLVASSGTMQLAVRAIRVGDVAATRRWIMLTLVLGTVFLANQVHEWTTVNFSMSSHAFGSAFFVMTGFHGLHVLGGLVVMVVVLGRSTSSAFEGIDATTSVEVTSYYWHFVDVVWLWLFATLFLLR